MLRKLLIGEQLVVQIEMYVDLLVNTECESTLDKSHIVNPVKRSTSGPESSGHIR
jgi:hypothetical protein